MRGSAVLYIPVLLGGYLAAAQTLQPGNAGAAVPTFYAESRQIIIEAQVWNHRSSGNSDTSWIPQESLERSANPAALKKALSHMPTPAYGLQPVDFHILDNDVEQRINYFKEADFSAADISNQRRLILTIHGTWETPLIRALALELPSATYLIGYVPNASASGVCRTIRVLVQNHEVVANRSTYCVSIGQESERSFQVTALGKRMRTFLDSSKRGTMSVSAHAFSFGSSGVFSELYEPSQKGAAGELPTADYTYAVEVHDDKAPARVQIATDFVLQSAVWRYPCPKEDPTLYVLGVVFRRNSDVAGQFVARLSCSMIATPEALFTTWKPDWLVPPTRFSTQLELPPGDFDLRVVVSDGHAMGRADIPLRVAPLRPQQLEMSDVVLSGSMRNASWVVREAAAVSPAPVTPSPLVSKEVQFWAEAQTWLRRSNPLAVYFELYQPQAVDINLPIKFRLRIVNLHTGALVMSTEMIDASKWVVSGNVVIPVGLTLDTKNLETGSYNLEVQASDAAGNQTGWRTAKFEIR